MPMAKKKSQRYIYKNANYELNYQQFYKLAKEVGIESVDPAWKAYRRAQKFLKYRTPWDEKKKIFNELKKNNV